MSPRPWTRQTALIILTLAVILWAALTLLHRGQGRSVSAGPVVGKEGVAGKVTQTKQPQAAPPSENALAPEIRPEEESAFASLSEYEISQLHEGITLAQWTDLNGNNEGWEKSTDEAFFDCRTLTKRETLPSGRQVNRTVYFYPPQAPTPAIFPTVAGQELINKTCLLAMIRVQTPTPADQDGHALAQATQKELTKQYGASGDVKKTAYRGSGIWQDGGRWVTDSEIVSAYAAADSRYDPADPDRGSVFVFARLPVVYETEQNACCRLKAYRYRSLDNGQFHRAIALVGVDPKLRERVIHLYEALFEASASSDQAKQTESTELRDSVVPALGDWLKAVKGLPPARHAAGLYVADRLFLAAIDLSILVTGWRELRDEGRPELRSVLHGMGAEFEYSELGRSYDYSGNWLNEARKLDPDGTIGQMAVLTALARGGAPKLGRDADQDIFHTVVADGEWLLTKNPDPATAAQIHFIIGDAFSDIVALAGGAEPDYGDPGKYQPEADSARKKALEHYRAGLSMDGISENAKDAWLQAWRLSAGLPPTTRYVYIYD